MRKSIFGEASTLMSRKIFLTFLMIIVSIPLSSPVLADFSRPSAISIAQSTDIWMTLDDVQNAVLSPDGHYLAVRTSTQFLLYDINPALETPSLVLEDEGAPTWWENAALAFSPDGRWIAANIPQDEVTQTIRVWDVESKEVVAEVTSDFYTVDQLAFSPTNPVLVIAHRYGSDYWMGLITVWDVEQDAIRQPIEQPNGGITIYPFSPDGRLVMINVSNGSSSLAMIMNMDTLEITRLGYVGCPCRINPTWEYVSWYTSANSASGIFALPDGGSTVMTEELEAFGGFAWNYDGSLVAKIESTGCVRIWNVETNARWTIGVATESTQGMWIRFHPNENIMAIALPENRIEFWDVDTSKFLAEISGYADTIERWAFSPNGQWFAVYSDDEMLYVWDLDTEAIVNTYHIEPYIEPWLRDLRFNADGTVLIALGSQYDPTLYVWRFPQEEIE